ncbi:MAG: hypothetical protein INH41_04725 [Myxococcaceae bacterium]|jgi:hypothetical protein|nr:hypothetical protein [Myxococcaceae bacterium]MCA3011687.1 hypothetical protein [Myxococcaceae bacterium]
MLRSFASTLLLVGCATTPAAASLMADLRALDRQEGYAELLARLKDVAPSQRDADWEALAAKANVMALDRLEIDDARSGEAALTVMAEQPVAFPSLRRSSDWLQKRTEVGLKAFRWTFGNHRHSAGDEPWVPRLLKFAAADPQTRGLAQRLAKELVLERLVSSSAWPLYELAFEREGDAVCADPKLVEVVLDAIDSEAWLDEMSALVTKRCAAQLKAPVAERLKKNESKSFRRGACKVLAGQADVADALKVCSP